VVREGPRITLRDLSLAWIGQGLLKKSRLSHQCQMVLDSNSKLPAVMAGAVLLTVYAEPVLC
jgi:hypothetical protein